jgi:hypothetical protein
MSIDSETRQQATVCEAYLDHTKKPNRLSRKVSACSLT